MPAREKGERAGPSLAKASLNLLFVLLFATLAAILYRSYEAPHQTLREYFLATHNDAESHELASTETASAGVSEVPSLIDPAVQPSQTSRQISSITHSSRPTTLTSYPTPSSSLAPANPAYHKPSNSLWSTLTRLIIFGDSLTAIDFNSASTQPSPGNPFGNPVFPKGRFNGPVWADFLTTTYNASGILTYNFAKGGATIDNAVARSPYGSPSFADQTHTFLEFYRHEFEDGTWDASTALAAIRFGVNDCVGDYISTKYHLDIVKDMARYAQIVESLYETGLRHFLFLNVGPVDGNYMSTVHGTHFYDLVRLQSDIQKWNAAVKDLKAGFLAKHADASARVFDNHEFFVWLERTPTAVEATRELKNTTGICPAYAGAKMHPFIPEGAPHWELDEPECGVPLKDYFWANEFHVTPRVQNATAAAIVEDCFGEGGVKRFCS